MQRRPSEVNATEFSLWDEHPVEQVGHRWECLLTCLCNGCGVCITVVFENNVPVVGKDEVRKSEICIG